jgi:hypothetical protein
MRARHLLHGLSVALALTLVPAAIANTPAPGSVQGAPPISSVPPGTPPPGSVRLSDERGRTRWAHPEHAAVIREQPQPNATPIGPLNLFTEDGFPEVYLLLRSWSDSEGHSWLQVRVPMRPNGRTGWVEAEALGPARLVATRLVVDRRRLRATLHRRGRKVWRSRIGIGKRTTPTPQGRFWIRELVRPRNPRGSYGPLAFGTSAYSRLSEWPGGGVIGIHGTDQPKLIPGRPSHGCIRIPNPAIRKLARLMPIGTPVWIR